MICTCNKTSLWGQVSTHNYFPPVHRNLQPGVLCLRLWQLLDFTYPYYIILQYYNKFRHKTITLLICRRRRIFGFGYWTNLVISTRIADADLRCGRLRFGCPFAAVFISTCPPVWSGWWTIDQPHPPVNPLLRIRMPRNLVSSSCSTARFSMWTICQACIS